jgi:hypothetical protein
MTGFPQSVIDSLTAINSKPAGMVFSDSATFTVSPSIALVSTKVLSANINRRGLLIYNNSANSVYITYSSPASSSGCHIIIPTFATYVMPSPIIWRGDVYAIRNAGSGALNMIEFL